MTWRHAITVALAVLLAAGCASGPAARSAADSAAYLHRAADSIDLGLADTMRAREHWGRALALAADAWPELRPQLEALAVDTVGKGDAVLREAAGMLRRVTDRSVADGRPPAGASALLKLAEVFRGVADNARRSAGLAAPQLERIRDGDGGGTVGDRAVHELSEATAAMNAAAAHYDTAANEIEWAAAAG